MRKFGFPRRCARSVEKKIKDICESGVQRVNDIDDGTPVLAI